jgi:predicted nucleotidyltransferase
MNEIADIPIQAVVSKLRELAPTLRTAGVARLYLFGSRARGDARPGSDLDVLIERTSAAGFDYFKVLHLIEDNVGLQVQVSMRDLLKPRVAERIADDLIEVF